MFKIQIATGNDAFDEQEGNAGPELARILDEIADRIRNGVADNDFANIRDINGATVGDWSYASEHDESNDSF